MNATDECLVVLLTGAVYLKNMIIHHWDSNGDGTAAEFIIHDSDKNVIRDNIVEAVIASESLIRFMFSLIECYRKNWNIIRTIFTTNRGLVARVHIIHVK